MEKPSSYEWFPGHLHPPGPSAGSRKKFGLLVLNTDVLDQARLVQLWGDATLRVLVDGGANRWESCKGSAGPEDSLAPPPPDLVTGDFDSIEPELLATYEGLKGCKVVRTPDQDYTDFTKALLECAKYSAALDILYAYVEHSGRLDQILGSFETLYHVSTIAPDLPPVWLVSSSSAEWLLAPGKHTVHLEESEILKKRGQNTPWYCGLVPLGGPCSKVTTTGLKWNLSNQELAFGKLVSTSNQIVEAVVTIETDSTLLWTMDI